MNTKKLEIDGFLSLSLIIVSATILVVWYTLIVAGVSTVLFQYEIGFIDYRIYSEDYLVLIAAFLFGCYVVIKHLGVTNERSFRLIWIPVSVTIYFYFLYAIMSSLFN